jgi:predicted Zn-dependent peptidase
MPRCARVTTGVNNLQGVVPMLPSPRWLLAGALAAAPAPPSLAADIPHEQFTLSNGLRVVVHEDRKAPIVAVSVWYHVGSKDEKPGKTGFAHLFEHLMFQGSENYKDEYFKPMEDVGATDLNGTTWLDRTNYFQNVPTPALDLALWLESDRMGHFLGAVTQELLDEQRGVVQNEKRQGDNEPYGKVFEAIQKYSYPEGHPYRWETIGSMQDLDAASLADVKAWFAEYYGPNNTVVVLAGDIDAATARQKMERYFGDIPPGPPVARLATWVARRDQSTRMEMQDRVAQSRVYKSWNVAELANADVERLQLLASVLGGGKGSRLFERLVYRDQLADKVSAYVMPFELSSMFWVQADVRKGVDEARVERIIDEEIARLLAQGPTADEVRRARTQFRAGFIRGIERIGGFGGKADVLAECAVYLKDPGCYERSWRIFDAATPAGLKAAGQRWLARGDLTLTVTPFPALAAGKSDVDRGAGLPKVARYPDLRFPAIQRGKLANGIEVILAERHETPIVNLQLLFDAGYAADQGHKLGTSSFAMGMLDEGTRTRSALDIAREAEGLGASLGAGSGLDSSSVSLSALKDQLAPSLALMADVVRNPAFDAGEFARVQAQWIAQIAQEKTQPSSLALRTLPPLLYGAGHAYAMPFTGTGTEASIRSLEVADLRAFHAAWIRPDNARLLVTGDTTMAEIVAALDKVFGDWNAPAEPRPAKLIAKVEPASRPRVFLMDKPGAEQSVILAGQLVPSTRDAGYLATETMNDVFGGTFTARLNMNLREDKSWAYGAYSFASNAQGQRPWIIWAPVQTDRTLDSVNEIRKELEAFTGDRPPQPGEIDRIQANSVRALPGQYETSGAVLNALAGIVLYDRPDDYVQTLKARTEALADAEVVQASAQVRPQAQTWVVVGDLSKIEQPLRKAMGEDITVIDADGNVLR